ncbi:3-deoxy-7-phosphoheptulonate synthase [Streptomyces sp. VRA16 Mangrove soil]|uniref:3-deoxy-7-phosphoheptulonate synthase n=1 Tax=Streptomyces sp. VRA16 Mangrove soil TaxID=2817434 RepID=UPI001A9F7CBA|nr:3-deoxy-7-phosphoheptulonate synthase [Streptomyces sp. VRA16 Mangrove soil]MBO1337161.1 3-deoxy-7-phosphoheptulonate synthase [Streptomyces sp. VRA16 Mangrove soil]
MALSGTRLPLPLADAARQDDVERWKYLPTAQQPNWDNPTQRDLVCRALSSAAPLVTPGALHRLKQELSQVALGEAQLIQAGDCAESFDEYTPEHIRAKSAAVAAMARRLGPADRVVAIARTAGQFAKPRSEGYEEIDGELLPSFRGHLVNGEGATAAERANDPARMLRAYDLSAAAAAQLDAEARAGGPRVWTSHEALVMDYEVPLVRYDDREGRWFLGSAHLPWIGERTRDVRGAHVRLFANISNPVACKIGPSATPEQVLELCRLLDPEREAGRLVLVARMGHRLVAERLPELVRAVRSAGHPVVWVSDPVHGNTVRTPGGVKTRYVDQVAAEAVGFARVLTGLGLRPGGLHLETAADPEVTECVGGPVPDEEALGHRYTTLCDPRLNLEQALTVIDRFREI